MDSYARASARLALAFSVVAFCRIAPAQNLVTNPDFDTDISNWVPNGATVSFDASKNKVGAPGSGAISVTNDIGMGITALVRQCLLSPFPAPSYDFGGWMWFPTAQNSGSATVAVSFYTNTACSGNTIGFQSTPAQPFDGWMLYTSTIVTPLGALSASVDLRIDMPINASPPVQAWFDGIRFGPSPTLPVEIQSFEVD